MVLIPGLRTQGPNAREHWAARAKRVRSEREAAAYILGPREKPALPCSVILTRMAPSIGLDDDNLVGSLKGVRDQVADWLGVNDRDRMRVRYVYRQIRAPWGVGIEFGPPVAGAQLEIEARPPVEVDAFGVIPQRVSRHVA